MHETPKESEQECERLDLDRISDPSLGDMQPLDILFPEYYKDEQVSEAPADATINETSVQQAYA